MTPIGLLAALSIFLAYPASVIIAVIISFYCKDNEDTQKENIDSQSISDISMYHRG